MLLYHNLVSAERSEDYDACDKIKNQIEKYNERI